jgi:hypothetical protein
MGPVLALIYASGPAANAIEERKARLQVRKEMTAERNRLRVEYYEKLLASEDDGIYLTDTDKELLLQPDAKME